MALRVYDPASITVTFAGIPIGGFADGTFLNVEQNEDSFTLQVGSSGDATRSRTNNRSGRVTVTLQMSSFSNDLLSAQHSLDLNSPGGDGIAPLLVKDLQGTTLVTAEKAWIVKPPSGEYAREATNREWVIESDNLIQFHGGNL